MAVRATAALIVAVLMTLVLTVVGAGAVLTSLLHLGTSHALATALKDIPPHYLLTYQQAATACPGLDWSVLAAIGKIESDHGRSRLPGVKDGHNSAGAEGPMQFLPATFTHYAHPIPDGGVRPPSPYDPIDAIYAAARYLCASGAAHHADLRGALYTYNHSHTYVDDVLAQADAYRDSTDAPANRPDAVRKAITFAKAQIGKPYVWGGDGLLGFDCSGLTHAAYAAAGIDIPRTAKTQYAATQHLRRNATLLPGDLVFYGTRPSQIHHVGLYLGRGFMIDAPDIGRVVTIDKYRWPGDDYYAATRPTAP